MLIGIIISIGIANWTAEKQAKDSEHLGAQIKHAEIVMALMNQLADCRYSIAGLTSSGKIFLPNAEDPLIKCRAAILPSLAGLKILQNDLNLSTAKQTYLDLSDLDRRLFSSILELRKYISMSNSENMDGTVKFEIQGSLVK